MMLFFAFICFIQIRISSASRRVEFFLDSESSSDNQLSLSTFLPTLRSTLNDNKGDVDIFIHLAPGIHRVPFGGLHLSSDETPINGRRIHWIGSSESSTIPSIISGGEIITNWTLANDPKLPAGVYKAYAPSSLNGRGIRHLYVDNKRAKRTSVLASTIIPSLTLEQRDDCQACSYTVSSTDIDPLQWTNPEDVEFVYSGVASGWSESRCAVLNITSTNTVQPNCTVDVTNEPDCGYAGSTESDCINNKTSTHPNGCCWHQGGLSPSTRWCVAPAYPGTTTSTRINMRQPCFWNLVNRPSQPIGGSSPISVENVKEHLVVPGQFYSDKVLQIIYYYPFPDQEINNVQVIAAVEETILSLTEVSRQTFTNITFAYGTWYQPGEDLGFVEQQSAALNICQYGISNEHYCGLEDVYQVTPGNVALLTSQDILFVSCVFTHLGAYGASARNGSQYINFTSCKFNDISAGALMLGDTASFNITDITLWDANITVSDCSTVNTGVEYTGSTVIFAAYVADTTLEHNLIQNASYSSITLGWGWGREASRRGGNRVIGNYLQGSQLNRCCDGGGFYSLGPQPNSFLTANYIAEGIPANSWGPSAGNAIYHDNGSGGFTDSLNVIDGLWGTYFFQDDSLGPYGPGALCPGRDGSPANCGMLFENNWMRTNAGGTTSHVNTSYSNNIKINPTDPFPSSAQEIVNAAGPRV
jgi:hypothetical protein